MSREVSKPTISPNRTGAMDPEGVGGSRADNSAPPVTEDPRIYCVVNTTTANLLGEFDTMAEAQGFLRDLGDYTDNIVVEVIDE